jgi:glycosyltransferase involved in cell wall biosynthesis
MKIAVIGSKGLPAKQGGIERHCEELYSKMAAQGHSVDLFARQSYIQGCDSRPYQVKGVQVIPLPSPTDGGIEAVVNCVLAAMATSGTRYDIVHFHAIGPALFSWIPKLISSAKVVVTCHGLDWQRAKWGKFSGHLLRKGESTAIRHADGLIVVSEELRSYFRNTYNREAIYISNAPAGLDASDPDFSYGKSLGLAQGGYIIFLGRLVPEKRPDLLIQAFQQLEPKGWKLVLVGGSSDTNDFVIKTMELARGNPNIIFTGQLLGGRLAEIVRGAGLFVLPSDLEGLPLAMLEGMKEGVPVLASNIPVHQQLLGTDRGLLFKVGDVVSCTQSLEWAIHHPENLAIIAKNAQQYVEMNHDWNQITAQTLEIYNQLLSSHNSENSGTVLAVNRSVKIQSRKV